MPQERAGVSRWGRPRARWPYAVAFAALSAGLGLAYAALCALFGHEGPILMPDQPLGLAPETRTNLVIAAILAFLLVARQYERSRDDLEQLRRQTGLTRAEFAERVLPPPARRGPAWLARGLGALVGIGMIPASSSDPSFVLQPAAWDVPLIWALGLNSALFGVLG